jgi:hypothetical protein
MTDAAKEKEAGSFLERVSDFLLCHNSPIKFNDLARHFSKGELDRNKETFAADERFSFFEEEGGTEMLSRQNIGEEEIRVRDNVLAWKGEVMDCFRKNGLQTPVRLSELAALVPRDQISVSIPSILILEADHKKKFDLVVLTKKPLEVLIKYVYSQEEWGLYKLEDSSRLEQKKEEWRKRMISFLLKQKISVRIHSVGTSVKKPSFLSPRIKCIDVIRVDPLHRFQVSEAGGLVTEKQKNDNGIYYVSLTREYLSEHWRLQLSKFFPPSAELRLRHRGCSLLGPPYHCPTVVSRGQ